MRFSMQTLLATGTAAGIAAAISLSAFAEPLHGARLSAPSLAMPVQYLPGSGFENPKIHDVPVDWCSTYGTNCGPGGATLFCGTHGFGRALSWNVISVPKTYVIGSSRYCQADSCKGYSFIRCG
jgi:hypothetical protein